MEQRGLKLARLPLSLAATVAALPSISEILSLAATVAALPSISEIPFLDFRVPAFLIKSSVSVCVNPWPA